MTLTLEEFIIKAREHEEKKVKIATIEIEDFGAVEFQRPSANEFLKFQKEMLASIKELDFEEKEEKSKIDMSQIDIEKFAKVSSAFIYNSCSALRAKEIRSMYPTIEFEDIPLNLFGDNEAIGIATKVYNTFKGKKEVEKIVEAVKN